MFAGGTFGLLDYLRCMCRSALFVAQHLPSLSELVGKPQYSVNERIALDGVEESQVDGPPSRQRDRDALPYVAESRTKQFKLRQTQRRAYC